MKRQKQHRVSVVIAMILMTTFAWPATAQSQTTQLSVVPPTVLVGSSDLRIAVTGISFTSDCNIRAGSSTIPLTSLSTTFIDGGMLQAVVPGSFLATPGTVSISVSCSGPVFGNALSLFVASASPPAISSMNRAGGARGATVGMLFQGSDLTGISVSFSGSGLSVDRPVSSGGFNVTIAPDAPLGPQTMTITTLGGSTTFCGTTPCTFTVLDAGSWTDVSPVLPAYFVPRSVIQLLDGRLFVIGIQESPPGTPLSAQVNVPSAQILDPATMLWTTAPSPKNPQPTSARLIPDGRVLVSGPSQPSEIYDPVTGTWSPIGTANNPGAGAGLLLPSGKLLSAYSNGTIISLELFDPSTGELQSIPGISLPTDFYGYSTALLADGRVLFAAGSGVTNRIYDPNTGALSSVPALARSNVGESVILLPDGRVLAHGGLLTGPFAPAPFWVIYDPKSNTVQTLQTLSLSADGTPVIMPDGTVFISGTGIGLAGTVGGSATTYDPVTDRSFTQTTAAHPVGESVLLSDGRLFGIEYRYSSNDLGNSGVFAQLYTPASYTTPTPVIGAVISNDASSSEVLSLDIHGSSFVSNSAVWLGNKKLVTLYLGSQHLVAFVPPALRTSMTAGIIVNNPGPGGGSTDPVQPGFRSAPLVINDVESGSIRTGYIVVTPDAGTAAPTATLTYGIVQNALVQSQAAILPTPLTTDTTLIVDAVPAIGRNLGIAVANSSTTATLINLTLRDESGNAIGFGTSFTLPPHNQVAKFVTEMFTSSTIGAAFRGSLEIQSQVPVSIVGLRFSGQEFSTVPVPASGATSTQIVFPQFAISGGWATTLGLVNNGSTAVSGRIDIFDPSGDPLALPWNGVSQSTFNYSLAPHASTLFSPRDSNGQSPF